MTGFVIVTILITFIVLIGVAGGKNSRAAARNSGGRYRSYSGSFSGFGGHGGGGSCGGGDGGGGGGGTC